MKLLILPTEIKMIESISDAPWVFLPNIYRLLCYTSLDIPTSGRYTTEWPKLVVICGRTMPDIFLPDTDIFRIRTWREWSRKIRISGNFDATQRPPWLIIPKITTLLCSSEGSSKVAKWNPLPQNSKYNTAIVFIVFVLFQDRGHQTLSNDTLVKLRTLDRNPSSASNYASQYGGGSPQVSSKFCTFLYCLK